MPVPVLVSESESEPGVGGMRGSGVRAAVAVARDDPRARQP